MIYTCGNGMSVVILKIPPNQCTIYFDGKSVGIDEESDQQCHIAWDYFSCFRGFVQLI